MPWARGPPEGAAGKGGGRGREFFSPPVERTSWGPPGPCRLRPALSPALSQAVAPGASLTQRRGREGGKPGIPFLASNSIFWSWPQGEGVGWGWGEEREL